MDTNEAIAILRNEENIDKPHIDCIRTGLSILVKYYDGKPMKYTFSDGQVWVDGFEESVERMSQETVQKLSQLGWFMDEDCWSHYDSFVNAKTGTLLWSSEERKGE